MNRFCFLVFAFILFSACDDKGPTVQPGPTMKYIDLHQAEAKKGSPQRLDLDQNGTIDFSFTAFLIGDPILKQDRLTFVAASKMDTYLLSIDNTETGRRLNKGDKVGLIPPDGYDWFEIALIVMAEKITSESSPIYWRGEWKDASHHYLPVQIRKNGFRYNGWIELSMDIMSEKIILHKAAISTEADKDVSAGY